MRASEATEERAVNLRLIQSDDFRVVQDFVFVPWVGWDLNVLRLHPSGELHHVRHNQSDVEGTIRANDTVLRDVIASSQSRLDQRWHHKLTIL
jgi:hypothetical protein